MTTILIIEDDDGVRAMVSGILSIAGYSIIEAADAPSGFSAALERKPDLILSDFILPGALGMPHKNLFEKLASDAQTKDIPLIIASGLPKETVRSNVPKHLWDSVLNKPIDYMRLQDLIADALKRKK